MGLEGRGRARPVGCAVEAGFPHPLGGPICSYFEMKRRLITGECVEGAVTRSDLPFEKVILGS